MSDHGVGSEIWHLQQNLQRANALAEKLGRELAEVRGALNDATRWELERLAERLRRDEPDNFPTLQALDAVLALPAPPPRRTEACPQCRTPSPERIVGLWLCQTCGHEWDTPHTRKAD